MFLKKINFLNRIPVTIKISLWYSSFIALLLGFIVLASMFFISEYSDNISKKELIEDVNRHSHSRNIERMPNFDDGVYYSLYDEDGNIVSGLIPNDFAVATISENQVTEIQIGQNTYYYYDVELDREEVYLRGVVEVSAIRDIMYIFPIILIVISPFILAVASYVGYRIMKRAFEPVRNMTQAAEEIARSGDLSKRIDLPRAKDEINTLAQTFNSMLINLEKSSDREKRFSSDVSHELRTPITVVMAEAEYASKYAESLEESKESLAIIDRQAKRMTHMINQILEISRLDNTEKIEKEDIDLSQMFEGLTYDYSSLIEKNDLEAEVDIDKNIHLNANRDLMHRLVDNVLLNAVKYADKKVSIKLKEVEQRVKLQIIDDGIGISDEDKEKVWDRFYKVDKSRTRTENQSSGLGLSISKKIADLHGADIRILDNAPKGTIIEIEFKG